MEARQMASHVTAALEEAKEGWMAADVSARRSPPAFLCRSHFPMSVSDAPESGLFESPSSHPVSSEVPFQRGERSGIRSGMRGQGPECSCARWLCTTADIACWERSL
eukprot:458130-Rhodomonas_salina.1